MDTLSFINFTIGDLPSTKQVIVAAAVTNNKIVVKLLRITGLNEGDNRFSIYPNPTRLMFNIDLNEPMDDVQFEILTTDGQQVKADKLNSTGKSKIDVSSLAGGIYIVELVRHGEVIKNFRIILE